MAGIFERFTEPARQVVVLAQEEARLRGSSEIALDHLTLGVVREEKGVGAHSLLSFGVDYATAGSLVGEPIPQEGWTTGQIPFTTPAKKALEYALRESLSLGHNYIGTEHVLLGIVRTIKDTTEPSLLLRSGLEPDEIRNDVIRTLYAGPSGRRTARSPEPPPEPLDPAPPRLEAIRTHSDRPADNDELGRARLAEVLAERMRRVRGEDTEKPIAGRVDRWRKLRDDRRRARDAGSFMINIHAAWGAGKSSLLNFLAVDLRNRRRRERSPLVAWLYSEPPSRRPVDQQLSQWVIVEFSAWEHQRLDPPWWWLLAAIRRSAARELWHINRGRWAWFWSRDLAWRLWNSRVGWMTVALVAVLLVLAWQLDWLGLEGSSLTALQTTAVLVTALLAFCTLLWGRIRGTSRWLAVGSSDDAHKFLKRVHDPLGVYRRRFRWLVRSTGRPIAVFIDDLDRCRADYVVGLLEGIQTVFAAEPVTYVVAADRNWVCEAFSKTYEDFEAAVGDPGRPLGFLFLEKTFQVSMEIPPLLHGEREDYWRTLTGAPAQAARASPGGGSVEWIDRVQRVSSERELLEEIETMRGAPFFDDLLKTAVRKLNSPTMLAELEATLHEFAPLLEPNPRSMKRLVNAYGIERDRLFREQRLPTGEERKQLVLFTILRLRWPLLAEHLLKCPNDAAYCSGSNGSAPEDHRFAELFAEADVRALFEQGPVAAKLDTESLLRYSGRPPEQAPSVGA